MRIRKTIDIWEIVVENPDGTQETVAACTSYREAKVKWRVTTWARNSPTCMWKRRNPDAVAVVSIKYRPRIYYYTAMFLYNKMSREEFDRIALLQSRKDFAK